MVHAKYTSLDTIARIIRDALGRGSTVDIDGLGSFRRNGKGYSFTASSRPRVFIAYAHEDSASAAAIFDALTAAGFDPWMDQRKLRPGQNWKRAIENALERADFVVCCFSCSSTRKRGGFQFELRLALDCARRVPLEVTFLLPVRLDDCKVPFAVARETQYVDLFPDWTLGIRSLVAAMRQQIRSPKAA